MRTLLCFLPLLLLCCLVPAPCTPAQADEQTFVPEPARRLETLTGYSRPVTRMQVSSEVPGRVLQVFADVGEQIPENGLFVTLDDIFVRLDLQEQKAVRAQLESSRDYYQKETRRYRDLVAGRHADQSTLDKFEQQLDQAKLKISAVDVRIESLTERLERYKVHAPAGFTVITRQVEPGEWVNAGQNLATLGDFRTLVAPFALDRQQYRWLKDHEDDLILRIQGLHDQKTRRIKARLHETSPGFDEKTRKINVQLAFEPGKLQARGGLRVELDIRIPARSGAVLVPASSLSTRYEQHWLTRQDGSRLHVVLLGKEPDGRLRVQAKDLTTSQRFLLHPGQRETQAP